jgi:hypothetical protein
MLQIFRTALLYLKVYTLNLSLLQIREMHQDEEREAIVKY